MLDYQYSFGFKRQMNSWWIAIGAFTAGLLPSWLPYGSIAVGPVQVSFGLQGESLGSPIEVRSHCTCTNTENQTCPEISCGPIAGADSLSACPTPYLSFPKFVLLTIVEFLLCTGIVGYFYPISGFNLLRRSLHFFSGSASAHSLSAPLAIEENVDQSECDRAEEGGQTGDQLHRRQDIISRASRSRPRSLQTVGSAHPRA